MIIKMFVLCKYLFIFLFFLFVKYNAYPRLFDFNLIALDGHGTALGGAGVASSTSRTAALYMNPALLTGFSKLGAEASFGFLYQQFNMQHSDYVDTINPNFFFTGSLAVQYEIIENLHFGFLFTVPKNLQIKVTKDQIIKNFDTFFEKNSLELASIVQKKFNFAINEDLIKLGSTLIRDYISELDVDLYWTTYEMSPSIAYQYEFFKIGYALNLYVHEFRGLFAKLPKKVLFTLGSKLGIALDFPYISFGSSITVPLYLSEYHAFRYDFPSSWQSISTNFLGKGDDSFLEFLKEIPRLKQVEIQKLAATGLQFVLGIAVDLFPDIMKFLLDYRMFYQGEKPGENLNFHIIPILYSVIFKKEIKPSDKFSHNFTAAINIDAKSFPLAFRLAYNYIHVEKDSGAMPFPNHLISFGFGIKLWDTYFIDFGALLGLPKKTNFTPIEAINLSLNMEYYKFIISFKMNIL